MYSFLYMFYFNTLFAFGYQSGQPGSSYNGWWQDMTIEIFGKTFQFKEYICHLMATASVIFIFVLCCLFVYKIIKLVGNLIR